MDYKNIFKDKEGEGIFIRKTSSPEMEAADKAALNRKGNIFFNHGDVERARRIFLTTGYSDGIIRIGDYYRSNGRPLDALRMYWMAPDRKKAEPIILKLSTIIQTLMKEDQNNV